MKARIPTIIAVIVLMLAVGAGVFFIQNQQIFRIGASPDLTPQDIRISNITDSSLTVSWTTDKKTAGSVKWGESTTSVTNSQPSNETEAVNTHLVNVSGLTPQKTFYFKINSDGNDYDNSGIPWQAETGTTLGPAPGSKIISGTVMTATGEPAADTLVYLNGTGIATLAVKTTTNGSFVLPLENLRNSDLTAYANLAGNPTLQIYVQAGPSGISSVQFTPALTTIPTIVLGKTYDLRQQTSQGGSEVGGINLNLPEESTPASKFDITNATSSPSPKETVTLESIKNQETINTTKPELIGAGPAGTTITITINSTAAITGTTKVAADGTWKWEPPTNLSPGTHTITISWKDASGILQTLTKTFVVSAAEGPAFEATPSASPAIELPEKTATPTATPRAQIPSTQSGIPKSGTGLPTILGAGAAIILLVGAVLLAL